MKISRSTALFLLLVILALASLLRFLNLDSNPGWYTDEGTHLDIAKHLLDRKTQYLAINQSHLIFSRLPLFSRLLGLLVSLKGLTVLTLRQFTAGLGVLSVLLTYAATESIIKDKWVALAAALSLAIYPEAILYSRFGFSYNLLTPLLLIALWALSYAIGQVNNQNLTRPSTWPILMAAGAIGLGLVSDLAMISLIPWLLWFAFKWSGWDGALAMGVAGLPLGLYVVINLFDRWGVFWFDLSFVRSRLGGLSFTDQIWLVLKNFTLLLNQSSWFTLGFVGLWLVPAKTQRNLLLLALASPILILGRTVPLTELSFYYVAWILPILAIGLAILLRHAFNHISALFTQTSVGVNVALIVLFVPLTVSTIFTFERAQTRFGTSIDRFLLNADDATATLEFINSQTSSKSIVIASPGLAWGIDASAADFQMALAAEGIATPHLPANLPQDRFEFNPQFSNADYVIVDNLWRNWATFHIPELESKQAIFSQWPVIFSSGEIVIYQNPAKS